MTTVTLWPTMLLAFVGAFAGAFAVKQIDTGIMRQLVPVALILIALYFMFAPRLTDADSHARLRFALFAPLMGVTIGFYDGLFGPGTGSFLTMGFVALFGFGVTRAAGNTKMVNLMSNLGSLAMFIPAGDVLWTAALAMAVGAWLAWRVGVRHYQSTGT